MKKAIAILLLNILVFFVLRYLNIVVIYMIRDSLSSPLHGFWDFLPAYLVQLLVLMVVYIGKLRKDEHEGAFVYPICVIVVTLLYFASYYKLIPDILSYI